MKILLCHNYYQQPGGEDLSFAAEVSLLESRGHTVTRYTVHDDVIDQMRRLEVAARTLWNRQTYRELRTLIRRERPAVVHCTNIFPLISPAAYYAARHEGVPVVQSLRNYRLMCPKALLMRKGSICEACLHRRLAWPGIWHACYRNSRLGSAVVAGMATVHRMLGTWKRAVDLYFTLTESARHKFIEGGFPPEKILVKPNFLDPDPGAGDGKGGYAVFVGRLSAEKGIATLLECWNEFKVPLPLKIIGDGPLAPQVQQAATTNNAITWLRGQPHENVLSEIGDATHLVMPSLCYETFGRTIIEAFAKGTPAIVSRLGAMAELVDDGRTGLHFEAGNAADLANRIELLLADPVRLAEMRLAARCEYKTKYTADRNYQLLMHIYDQAGATARGESTRRPVGICRESDRPVERPPEPTDSP